MNFEDTKVGKTYLIKLKSGAEVEVYRSKTKPLFINAEDCSTTYPKENCTIVEEISNGKA